MNDSHQSPFLNFLIYFSHNQKPNILHAKLSFQTKSITQMIIIYSRNVKILLSSSMFSEHYSQCGRHT